MSKTRKNVGAGVATRGWKNEKNCVGYCVDRKPQYDR